MPAPARAGWGWHRLTEHWAETIVAAAGVGRGELVLDIGAGTGALTRALVAAARESSQSNSIQRARPSCGNASRAIPSASCASDAADLRLPRRPFRVVANPPYGITSALLRRLLAPGSRLNAADVVVQHTVARRWANGQAPGAGRWTRHYQTHMGLHVPRSAFRPPPRVDSTLLVVRRA